MACEGPAAAARGGCGRARVPSTALRKWEMNCRVFPTSVKFAEGLQQLIDKHDLKACILGTRRGDPNADDQVWRRCRRDHKQAWLSQSLRR